MENQQNIQVPVSNNPEPIVETSSPQNNRGNKSMKVISIVWVIGCAVIAGGLTVYNFIASFLCMLPETRIDNILFSNIL